MPASEGFYRNQSRLHLVFFISALAMFVVTIWMLAADHYKPWKRYQREFNVVAREKLEDDLELQQRKLDEQKLEDLNRQLAEKESQLTARHADIAALNKNLDTLKIAQERQVRALQFRKADQAEATSKFDSLEQQLLHVDPQTEAARRNRLQQQKQALADRLARLDSEIQGLSLDVEAANSKVGDVEKQIAAQKSDIEKITAERTKLTTDIDALTRSIEATRFGLAQRVRAMPILDAFASPLRVQQVALDDLPVDYNFKMATRYDRCMTCHLGIDKTGFTEDRGIKEPFCSHPHLDLYVAAKSKHPVDKFGCTICHQGQGTSTSFEWASHTPPNAKTREEWTNEYGWFFNHFHEQPMLPNRFIESSCLKCHHDPYQIPQAEKLLKGYQTVRTYGCFGCHEIDGFRDDGTSIGPNLRLASPTDSEWKRKEATRKVGPSLARVSEKVSSDFLWRWIRDPRSFRPTTRMPSFYNQADVGFFGIGPKGEFDPFKDEAHPKVVEYKSEHGEELRGLAETEVHALTAFLLSTSSKYLQTAGKMPSLTPSGDKDQGKELFRTKGCVACHNHKEHPHTEERNFGPDLSEISAKFTTPEQQNWLAAWIKNPAFFNPMSYMPNLQLTDAEAAQIAKYLTTVPGKFARELAIPAVDPVALRSLCLSHEAKGRPLDEAKKTIDGMSQAQQLDYLGQKTVARLGCFACHDIPGFETTKPIGVPLADWGRKDPHKLAFENVVEYVHEKLDHMPPEERANDFYTKNDYYLWALDHHQREGFLMQKIREPRSYDEGKIRRWEDRARMPQFNLNDEERDAVATFVLGLVGENINRKFVYNPSPAKKAEIKGRNLIEKYNCQACHVFEPGEYHLTPTEDEANKLVALARENLAKDYDFPGHSAWSVPKKKLAAGLAMTARGLPDGQESPDEAENAEDPKSFVRLWEATSVKGQVIPSGLKVAIPRSQMGTGQKPPYGGKFTQSLVDFLISKLPNPQAADARDSSWRRVPPPLLREGEKAQTAWLASFLREPVKIRPGVVLRMPKFNYRAGDPEALADFFPAADQVPYPYVDFPERETAYLAERETKHPHYLDDAWKLITNKELCIKCHPVGGISPQGKPEELGPELARAPERLRPEWMLRWIANPVRLLPYTQMPQNFLKTEPKYQEIFKGTSFEQVEAARDALVNYNRLTDAILTRQQAQAQPKPAGEKGGGP